MAAAVPLRKRSLSAAGASQRAVRLRGPLPTEDAAEPQGHESWTPRIRLGSKLRAPPPFEMQPRPNVGGFWEGTPLFETRSPWAKPRVSSPFGPCGHLASRRASRQTTPPRMFHVEH